MMIRLKITMMLIKVSDDDHDGDEDFFAAATGNLPVPPINQCNSTQLSGEHVTCITIIIIIINIIIIIFQRDPRYLMHRPAVPGSHACPQLLC